MEVIVCGGFCDVYKGTLGGAGVCIKRLRMTATGDQETIKKVSNPDSRRLAITP